MLSTIKFSVVFWKYNFLNVIEFAVNVPVLSENIWLIYPKLSFMLEDCTFVSGNISGSLTIKYA